MLFREPDLLISSLVHPCMQASIHPSSFQTYVLQALVKPWRETNAVQSLVLQTNISGIHLFFFIFPRIMYQCVVPTSFETYPHRKNSCLLCCEVWTPKSEVEILILNFYVKFVNIFSSWYFISIKYLFSSSKYFGSTEIGNFFILQM